MSMNDEENQDDHVRRDLSDTMDRHAEENDVPANWVGHSVPYGNESECQTPSATTEVVASLISDRLRITGDQAQLLREQLTSYFEENGVRNE